MPNKSYTKNIYDYATHGIAENINIDAKVEVSLRDLVFVKQTLAEFVQYFHNVDHYLRIENLHDYVGTRGSQGAYHLLSDANYKVMERMLPKSIDALYDNGVFDSPDMPFYFKPTSQPE